MERSGEYLERGDYHRHLDRRWAHYPIYVEKVRLIERMLDQMPPETRILDVGCGEGLLVERYRKKGFEIRGLDLHYESECVRRGDLLQLPEPNDSLDVVLALDVIEHLNFADQERALVEIQRVLKPGGRLIVTTPNLAHFSSRLVFLLTGRLLRTSSIERHPGDRPMQEYKALFGKYFEVQRVRGIFPTFPISSLLTLAFPAGMLWWHRVLNGTCAYPPWCFLNSYECRKHGG
ncbi:MAG: class I SAM-dependent methyltransferase [Planctomycetales bacterium]